MEARIQTGALPAVGWSGLFGVFVSIVTTKGRSSENQVGKGRCAVSCAEPKGIQEIGPPCPVAVVDEVSAEQ